MGLPPPSKAVVLWDKNMGIFLAHRVDSSCPNHPFGDPVRSPWGGLPPPGSQALGGLTKDPETGVKSQKAVPGPATGRGGQLLATHSVNHSAQWAVQELWFHGPVSLRPWVGGRAGS